jgi:hypothetical protein
MGSTALSIAASLAPKKVESVAWLLRREVRAYGPAWRSRCGRLKTIARLLVHGGANFGDIWNEWDEEYQYLLDDEVNPHIRENGRHAPKNDNRLPWVYDATAVTSLLQVIILRGALPAWLTARLSLKHAQVVEEGAQLRAGLPAYLAQRRALLDAHCPLIPPLRALVHGI